MENFPYNCTPNGAYAIDENLEKWIGAYGLPSLLENISLICAATASQFRSDVWQDEYSAKEWDGAAKAIDEATEKVWLTIDPQSSYSDSTI